MPLLRVYIDDDELKKLKELARQRLPMGHPSDTDINDECERMAEAAVSEAILRS